MGCRYFSYFLLLHLPFIRKEKKVTIGERLTDLRKQKQISVSELAKCFGCSRQYIHSLERSKFPVSRRMIEKYCEFFDVTADYIMGYGSEHRIPVYRFGDSIMDRESPITIPECFLTEGKEYFGLILGNSLLIILEKDETVHFEKQGVFKYKDSYYFSRLERYADGSVWLISAKNHCPEKVEHLADLASLGYRSYQLTY